MDYFSKFTKRIVPPKAQPTSAMQLTKFHKCWDYIHTLFFTEDGKSNVHVQQTEISSRLRTMVDLLVDEETRQGDTTAGVCMEYFLKNNILQYLVNEAEKRDYPVGFRGETIRMVATMVDLLDDRFLVHKAVHTPALRLLRFCVLYQENEVYTDDLVDLMYIICSKIHGFPALLNIFFHNTRWLTAPQKQAHTAREESVYEFFLFTYLVRFVHREGRSGDYARTGLLFLVEMATEPQLGEFILVSDFATILAAGLGALYSQLPRKVMVKESDSAKPGLEYAGSAGLRDRLDSFLKLLEFSQDVLSRCPNEPIRSLVLETIQLIFVENILYPSILECSDGSSSVAVLGYMHWILQTVSHPGLAKVILGSWMDPAEGSLRQLIFSRLRSCAEPVVIATLRLLKTLITHHCRYMPLLLLTEPEPIPEPTQVSHHLKEVELYLSLVAALDTAHTLSQGYEGYLQDIEAHMDADPCYQATHPHHPPHPSHSFRRRPSFKYGQGRPPITPAPSPPRPSLRHRLCPHDPLLQTLLDLLSQFFLHSAELNLALTGVLSALAFCPHRSLQGWITFSPSDRTGPEDVLPLGPPPPFSAPADFYAGLEPPVDEDDDEDDRSIDFGAERGSERMTRPVFFKSYPALFTLFHALAQQVDYYRTDIPSLSLLLHSRRQALVSGQLSLDPVHPAREDTLQKRPVLDFSLSLLLNNIVILEETIKEFIALIQVRRSLGVDRIAYV